MYRWLSELDGDKRKGVDILHGQGYTPIGLYEVGERNR